MAGIKISEGKIMKSNHIKVLRDKQIIYQGPISSLRRLKEEVLEVKEPLECGLFVKEFDVWQENDTIQSFNLIEKKKNK